MSIQELENAISQLSNDEFMRLAQWIDEYRAEKWDRQIEADIHAGRLDEAGRRADADFDAGALHAAMKHFATPEFWHHYRQLPAKIQELADKNFALLQQDPQHPSLRLKKIGIYWSARLGLHYRVLAKERAEGLVWFWIGHHNEYDQLLRG